MKQKKQRKPTFNAEVKKMIDLISKEICSGNWLPHEHLAEAKLSEVYSVSRMVIRQALTYLETVGIVTIEPYKGARIAPITLERIRHEYEIIGVLEGFATQLATLHMTDDDIAKLETIQAEHMSASDEDEVTWRNRNMIFHQTINRKCGNPKLKQLISQHIKFTDYWFLSTKRFHQNLEAHRRILEAIKERDGDAARRHMEQHIIESCSHLIENLDSIPAGAFRIS